MYTQHFAYHLAAVCRFLIQFIIFVEADFSDLTATQYNDLNCQNLAFTESVEVAITCEAVLTTARVGSAPLSLRSLWMANKLCTAREVAAMRRLLDLIFALQIVIL